MARTIVKKKELQKLISESIGRKKGTSHPQLNYKKLNESINNVNNRVRISIVKEGIRGLNIKSYRPILSEDWSFGGGKSGPGDSAANGLEELIKMMKKAGEMITDSTTTKIIKNSITRLQNTLAVLGTYAGAAQRGAGVDDAWLKKQLKHVPHPEVEKATEGDVKAAEDLAKTFFTDF
tara:strand:- start:736 stop:1269 length:534 start_codon:yes stop_codon:yes gene_type:complete